MTVYPPGGPDPDADDADDMVFADEGAPDAATPAPAALPPWKLLVADDEPEVHAVTTLALKGFRYENRGLAILHAHSGRTAVEVLRAQPDIAIVLMDVVMETDRAGLDAVRAIREELHNAFVRIILRTGQPGQAPEREIVTNYDINDYKEKTELTARKLFTMVYTVLGYYRQLLAVEAHRAGLERLVAELKRSNRELQQFATVASHDLSAPLRGIAGFSSLLEQRYAAEMPAEAREFLDYIQSSTRQMRGLVADLLALAQVGRKGAPAPVALDAVLDHALAALRGEIEASRATIERATSLPTVTGIEPELRQLLFNLLGNALKFRRPGVAPVVRLSAEPAADGGWCVRVEDNGIGIPAAERGRLFRVFERLHSAEEYEGTGVGLALCQRIAESHDGGIEAGDSVLGGASFAVRLG